MALSTQQSAAVTTEARRMSVGALTDKVNRASTDCGMHNVRLAQLAVNPSQYTAEIAATTRARDNACAWASVGGQELDRRQKAAAAGQVKATQQRGAQRAQPTSLPPTPPAVLPTAPVAPVETKTSTWPWVAGAAAVGLGILTLLGRQPKVVRYVKAIPKRVVQRVK